MVRPTLLLTVAVSVATPAVATPDHAHRTADRILSDLREVSDVPGLGAAVSRNGTIVWTGRAGYRDLARRLPVTDATRFRFASVSKIFAATAAAKLRENGRLDVDVPVATLLPGLNPAWAPFTARQLAAHTSGMPHYQPVDDKIDDGPVPTMADAVRLTTPRTLLAPPGSAYAYSTHGFTLLAAVVEARAGRPYLDYLRTAIAPDLAIGPDRTGSGDADMATAYEMRDGQPVIAAPRDLSFSWGGAGLAGTPVALATWGGRLLEGRVVGPATLRWMAQAATLNDGKPVSDSDYQLGLGWRLGKDTDGTTIIHHSGVTAGARSTLVLVPGEKLGAVLLANALWTAAIDRSALALAAPFRPTPIAATRPCPVAATRFAGQFDGKDIAGDARFSIEDGICVASLSAANPMGAWLDGVAKRTTEHLRLVGVDRANGLARAALVTPIGAYDVRPAATGYIVRFGPTRFATISFT